jgi:beta-galactosidase
LTKPTHQSIVHDITTPGARPQLADGKLITGFSYSGPKGGASVQPLTESAHIYSDRNTTFKDLPAFLKGKQAEYLQVPSADASYSALDLIQFSAPVDLDVYIAHDDKVAGPKWLTTDFTDTGEKLTVGNTKLSLFKKRVNKDTSLTLGSNFDETKPGKGLMYIVIAVTK